LQVLDNHQSEVTGEVNGNQHDDTDSRPTLTFDETRFSFKNGSWINESSTLLK